MNYLFQRIILNNFQWTRPSPGRLGPSGESKYVKENGFGHEDWNFNKSLLIDGYLYGYSYYIPKESKRDEIFNFAFATYTNRQWYLVGFYLDCEFINDPPYKESILRKKMRDLLQLGGSLGKQWRDLDESEFLSKLKYEAQWLKWRVEPDNAIRLSQHVTIPKTLFNTQNYRIARPTTISEEIFKKLWNLAQSDISIDDYSSEIEFPEGREIEIKHKARERNQSLVKAAKDRFRNQNGKLYCQVCGFNFEEVYGEIGKDFIEAHHTVPVSELSEQTTTKVSDIALVCSNCHRMLHRKRPWLSMDDLKKLIYKSV